MADDSTRGIPSTAAIGGHPIHPMLVPFPIAFLVAALVTDIAFAVTNDLFWARVSMWLLGGGLVMGALAALAGLTDFLTIRRARQAVGWFHFLGNAAALLIALANLWMRIDQPGAAVLPTGLVLSAIVVGILLVTGWLGGELAYRHKIGVIEQADVPTAEGRATRSTTRPV